MLKLLGSNDRTMYPLPRQRNPAAVKLPLGNYRPWLTAQQCGNSELIAWGFGERRRGRLPASLCCKEKGGSVASCGTFMAWRWIHSYIPPKDESEHGNLAPIAIVIIEQNISWIPKNNNRVSATVIINLIWKERWKYVLFLSYNGKRKDFMNGSDYYSNSIYKENRD